MFYFSVRPNVAYICIRKAQRRLQGDDARIVEIKDVVRIKVRSAATKSKDNTKAAPSHMPYIT